MKRSYFHVAVPALLIMALGACSSNDTPTGQVVATVDGVEITQSELNTEIAGMKGRNADEQKALERAALEGIVNRTILANAAIVQGLDKTPDGAMTKRRADQLALISLLEKSVAGKTPQVSNEEADEFVSANPSLFDQRRIFLVDQIAVSANTPKLLKDLEPLNTMAEVQAYLTSVNLQSQQSFGVIDALQTDPNVTQQILALAPDAVFILPQGDSIRINRIRDVQTAPVTGDNARLLAKEILVNQRRQQQLTSAFGNLVKAGQKKVLYSDAFKPKAAPVKKAAPAE
ncbi:MAG: hypothetical protein HC788_01890 [Sphingopyxis sp.]|nr:hypothetical protein [Sphingopyxis sp.]